MVQLALSRQAYKIFAGRPEWDPARLGTLLVLGNALSEQGSADEALSVIEAALTAQQRFWPNSKHFRVFCRESLAYCYKELGRLDEALQIHREVSTAWIQKGRRRRHVGAAGPRDRRVGAAGG